MNALKRIINSFSSGCQSIARVRGEGGSPAPMRGSRIG